MASVFPMARPHDNLKFLLLFNIYNIGRENTGEICNPSLSLTERVRESLTGKADPGDAYTTKKLLL